MSRARTWFLAVVACSCGRIDFAVEDGGIADGSASGFCAGRVPVPTFCDDFDEARGTSAWLDEVALHGTLAVDGSAGLSPPAALAITMAMLGAANGDVELDWSDPAIATHVTAGIAFRINATGTSQPVLIELTLDDGSTAHSIELVYAAPPDVSYIEDGVMPHGGTNAFTYDDLIAISTGTWHELSIDLESGAGSMLIVTLDAAQLLAIAPAAANGGSAELQIGAPFLAGPADPWQLDIDDVYLDVR